MFSVIADRVFVVAYRDFATALNTGRDLRLAGCQVVVRKATKDEKERYEMLDLYYTLRDRALTRSAYA